MQKSTAWAVMGTLTGLQAGLCCCVILTNRHSLARTPVEQLQKIQALRNIDKNVIQEADPRGPWILITWRCETTITYHLLSPGLSGRGQTGRQSTVRYSLIRSNNHSCICRLLSHHHYFSGRGAAAAREFPRELDVVSGFCQLWNAETPTCTEYGEGFPTMYTQ